MVECEACEGNGYTDEICTNCNGSGEGMYDGTKCRVCKGRGEQRYDCEECHAQGVIEEDV